MGHLESSGKDAGQDQSDLILSARRGDLRAFEKLVRSEQNSVRAFLAVRLSRTEEAEDLAQETFIIAYRELAEFKVGRPLRPWLMGIAHNLLRNHLRKFRAEPIGGSEELQVALDGFFTNHQSRDDSPDVLVFLEECLAQLDDQARSLIEARYINGESIKELRKKSGKGHSALTMNLHRIRETLGQCIEKKMGGSLGRI